MIDITSNNNKAAYIRYDTILFCGFSRLLLVLSVVLRDNSVGILHSQKEKDEEEERWA